MTRWGRWTTLLVLLGCASPPRPSIDLQAELGGRPQGECATLVVVFATYCFQCLGYLEVLRALEPELSPRGLTIQALALDLEGAMVVEPFREHAGLPFAVQVAPQTLREGRTALGRVSGLPTTYIADGQGRLKIGFEGAAGPGELRKALEPLLGRADATGLKRFSCPTPGD